MSATVPPSYQDLLAELEYNSPACGVFHYQGNDEVIEIIKEVTQTYLSLPTI